MSAMKKTCSVFDQLRGAASYLVRWNHGCDEHPCRVRGADCPCHEAWLDQSDLKQSGIRVIGVINKNDQLNHVGLFATELKNALQQTTPHNEIKTSIQTCNRSSNKNQELIQLRKLK